MDEQIPTDVNKPQSQTPSPAGEDAKQFSHWMAEYGRPALIGLVVAVVVLLGISVWRSQKEAKAAAAVQALFQSRSPEELQQLAAVDSKAPTAPLALASAAAEFYALNRYDEALAAYQRFVSLYPTHMLVPDATVGIAASFEALDKFDEAATSYEAFASGNTNSPLQPQAVFGAARCREQLGQFDEARALYEDFIAAHSDSSWLPQAESGLLFLKKAERAKNMPTPVASVVTEAAPVVAEETLAKPVVNEQPVVVVDAAAAPAGVDSAPVVEEATPVATEAAPVVAEETLAKPVVDEQPVAVVDEAVVPAVVEESPAPVATEEVEVK